ncbi:MAG TPA: HepT-like ribonuclease domain-containing protein [Burkholderiales bacterium]|nr:HepT-like ribonuclease domain-containing protein [Burkholderiales bacterium]
MARPAFDRLADVLEAIEKIREYTRGDEAAFRRNSMARDAVVARLIHIGQAIKDAQEGGLDLPTLAPQVPWRSIAGMRDRLVHKYWDVDHAIVWNVISSELGNLERAVKEIASRTKRGARTGKGADAVRRKRASRGIRERDVSAAAAGSRKRGHK